MVQSRSHPTTVSCSANATESSKPKPDPFRRGMAPIPQFPLSAVENPIRSRSGNPNSGAGMDLSLKGKSHSRSLGLPPNPQSSTAFVPRVIRIGHDTQISGENTGGKRSHDPGVRAGSPVSLSLGSLRLSLCRSAIRGFRPRYRSPPFSEGRTHGGSLCPHCLTRPQKPHRVVTRS